MNKQILVIMAHQDDEAAFSTRIAYEIKQGNSITCVYLTDGAGKGINPKIRDNESLGVLNNLGVNSNCIHFIGSQHNIPDGKLTEHLENAYKILEKTLSGKKFNRIYSMAYEGGHHDHDACHIITIIFSAKRNLLTRTWQMPLYNGFKTRTKLFRVLLPIPTSTRTLTRKLKLSEALLHTLSVLRYTSQWKTWMGLLPELIYQRLLRRREILQAVSVSALSHQPHAGPLLYERLFGYTYQQFHIAADQFLKNHGSYINCRPDTTGQTIKS